MCDKYCSIEYYLYTLQFGQVVNFFLWILVQSSDIKITWLQAFKVVDTRYDIFDIMKNLSLAASSKQNTNQLQFKHVLLNLWSHSSLFSFLNNQKISLSKKSVLVRYLLLPDFKSHKNLNFCVDCVKVSHLTPLLLVNSSCSRACLVHKRDLISQMFNIKVQYYISTQNYS